MKIGIGSANIIAMDTTTEKNVRTNKAGSFVLELVFIIFVVIFFAGTGQKWVLDYNTLPAFSAWSESKNDTGFAEDLRSINILVLGLDSGDGTYRSDTMIVMGVSPTRGRVSVVSIPRDTRVTISNSPLKINEIAPRFGVGVAISLIEDLMNIKIDRYVKVDFQGFVKLVDSLGGVEIDVERRMKYDDHYGEVHIDLYPGLQKLDGKKALDYVRYRGGPTADLGRIKRQQKFVRELFRQTVRPGFYLKLPGTLRKLLAHIETDFSISEILAIAKGFTTYRPVIKTSSLPGEARYIDNISYFLPYRDKAVELGAELFSNLSAVDIVASFSSDIKHED